MRNDSFSIFGQVDFKPIDRLTFTFGFNYTEDKKQVRSNVISTDVFSSLDLVGIGNTLITQQAHRHHRRPAARLARPGNRRAGRCICSRQPCRLRSGSGRIGSVCACQQPQPCGQPAAWPAQPAVPAAVPQLSQRGRKRPHQGRRFLVHASVRTTRSPTTSTSMQPMRPASRQRRSTCRATAVLRQRSSPPVRRSTTRLPRRSALQVSHCPT